jgi:uncharacterized membrane protein YhaH (DUF805 family)
MNTPTNLTNWYFEEVKKNIRLSGRSLPLLTVPGRVGRKDFARFLLCHFSLIIVLVVALVFITGTLSEIFEYSDKFSEVIILTLPFLFFGTMAYMFLTLLGACIRRLHDAGRSGLWVLLGMFFPVFFLLILFLLGTQPGKNKYDADAFISEKDFSSKDVFNAVTATK